MTRSISMGTSQVKARLSAARIASAAAFAAALGFTASALAAPSVLAAPTLPAYGDPVVLQLSGFTMPVFLPATRYKRTGSTITVDYEYFSSQFGPFGPQFGSPDISLGELPPGNYTVQARLIDMDHPADAAFTTASSIAVVPPQDWGLYAVPKQPVANDVVNMLVRSAAYFDPSTLRASMSGNTVRVDFTYRGSAPVGGPAPAGFTSFASVAVGRLPPGVYHAEGWGTPDSGGDAQRYFAIDFTVATTSVVSEFYQEQLDHYFMTAGSAEIDTLDAGGGGGWKRTGQSFHAWLTKADAPAGAVPVCRFYAAGPNSHFYTANASECSMLQALEQQQRTDADAHHLPFMGWSFENIAFYAIPATNGACPAGTQPVWRTFNNRASEDDSNHRFTADARQRVAMLGWIDEGVAFCAPQ
jgi:hypothetical protein